MKIKYSLQIIVLMLCFIFTSCVVNSRNETTANDTMKFESLSTSIGIDNTEIITTSLSTQIRTTTTEIFDSREPTTVLDNIEHILRYTKNDERRYESCLKILDAIKGKDEDTLKWLIYYPEGSNGWLFNIDVTGYSILSYSFGSFIVELNISFSNDDRFPVGKSQWRINFGGKTVHPLSINRAGEEVENPFWGFNSNPKRKIDEAVILACAYTTAFEHYDDVNDITIWSDFITADRTTWRKYVSTMHYFGYKSGMILTEDVVNAFYEETLGIIDTSEFINHEFLISNFTDDYLRLEDMKYIDGMVVYTIDDFYNDSLILTFYADSCLMTPAVTMQYNFSIESDKLPQLLSVKVLKDYGYEPVIVDSLSFG